MLPFASLHRTERGRPSGFTLIELLVVIAVISVLTAILFPVLAKVRDKARETTALSNLKQIGAALTDVYRRLRRTSAGSVADLARIQGVLLEGGRRRSSLAPESVCLRTRRSGTAPKTACRSRARPASLGTASWRLDGLCRRSAGLRRRSTSPIAPISMLLTIGPAQEPPEVYFWWRFCNPPLDRGPADLPRPYDDLMVAVQISPRRYVGDVAAYLFLDSHVKTLPFAQTWSDASTNLHYPFK